MQNFTLGKKRYAMLLFGLILLIGSSPTYGQTNCPTAGNTPSDQTFCFLQTVGDIDTDGNAIFSTADSTTDTQPIPDSELLDNTTYFAGNQSSTCTTRVAISVTVNAAPYPNNTLFPDENSFTISPCSNTFTAEELATYFTPITNYSIQVYSEEFGNAIATGPLTPNESYFVGQVSPSQDNSSASNCPSLRVAVGYEPKATPPPTADSPQTFCEGATVADLEAQGTSPDTQAIRWYRTNTSFQPLPDSTILINGQTYYATQIINDRNDPFPPCESQTRTPVTVNIDPATLNETTQSFCESVGTGNNFRKPQVQDLDPQGGTFYAESNSADPLDPSTELVQGEDYFNRNTGDDCTQDRITVNFFDTPNAGSTTQTATCTNEAPFDLVSRIRDSQLGPPQTTGFFTPALTSGNNTFIPEDYAAGTYTFRYTILGNSNCPTDISVISVEVQQAPNAGPDQTLEFCQDEIETIINLALTDPVAAQALLAQRITNADLNGSFSTSDLQSIALAYFNAVDNNAFPFNASAVYSVDNGNCTDTSNIGLLVNESPYAGDDTSIEVNSTDPSFNLYDVLVDNSSDTPDANGTFSPGDANGDFDPSTASSGTYTYTVTTDNGCTDSADINVTILLDEGCPDVTESTQSFCESISDADGNNPRRPRVLELSPQDATWYATADSETPIPGNTILINGNTYFAGNTSGTCDARMPVLVNIDDAPNAGSTTILNVCSSEAPFNIASRMNPSILGAADAGGSITPALASGTDLFDPAVDVARRYTYRVASQNSGCADDTAFVTINITDPIVANAGQNVSLTFCSTDGIQNLNDRLAADAFPGGTFSGLTNGQFDPSTATIGENTIITYTVDNSITCVSGTDAATYTINVIQGPNAGDDSSVTLSTEQEPVNLFAFIQGNPDAGGTFSPGNANGDLDPSNYTSDDYTFTYTVTSSNGCIDSSDLIVTITNEVVVCPEVADTTQEFCESISDSNGNNPRRPQVRDLMPANATWYSTATSTDALAATAVLANGDYFAGNPDATCTSRGRVSVIIDDSPNAGSTTIITVCSNEEAFDIIPLLNESILGMADAGGTFTPALASGTTIFDPSVDVARRYTYRVSSDNSVCPDDTTFVTINITDPLPANAGDIADQTVCSSENSIMLSGFLTGSGATLGGTFFGIGVNAEGTMFDPSVGPNTDGYTITYTVNEDDENACVTGEASSTFIITVNDPLPANAGDIADQTVCSSDDSVLLSMYLTESGASLGGTFSGVGVNAEGTMFDPSVGPNDDGYTITYTVNEDDIEACVTGEASSTFIITVTDPADAPTAEASQSFCLIDNPTVGDIVVTGDNIVIYTNADLTDVADATTALVSGMSYYAVSNNDTDTCSSDATEIVVTITDPAAPALSMEGDEFCRSDNPTVQDLINNFSGSGVLVYPSSTGGSAISATTALQNGVTYYGASVNGTTGCESSERLAVVAKVEFCGIPEGFSPNNDGKNDQFVIPDIATLFPNYTIEIFNRWGNVVFEGNASTPDWDGISNQSGTLGNDVLPVGVYFYILNYNDGQTTPVQGKLYLSI
ncbi:gliding motility-associated C-terminal domain-containing protein [Gillisia sp. JM1]|uniref:gliding motility-associated C-terminal domain-containing protein n=1 Tax=Gillisia sp. JM1 TaxID=1283286 RepID=UPI000478ED68|nr:T9SS C-terminal target domain-containing protein [Gillisia sp. JM1]